MYKTLFYILQALNSVNLQERGFEILHLDYEVLTEENCNFNNKTHVSNDKNLSCKDSYFLVIDMNSNNSQNENLNNYSSNTNKEHTFDQKNNENNCVIAKPLDFTMINLENIEKKSYNKISHNYIEKIGLPDKNKPEKDDSDILGIESRFINKTHSNTEEIQFISYIQLYEEITDDKMDLESIYIKDSIMIIDNVDMTNKIQKNTFASKNNKICECSVQKNLSKKRDRTKILHAKSKIKNSISLNKIEIIDPLKSKTEAAKNKYQDENDARLEGIMSKNEKNKRIIIRKTNTEVNIEAEPRKEFLDSEIYKRKNILQSQLIFFEKYDENFMSFFDFIQTDYKSSMKSIIIGINDFIYFRNEYSLTSIEEKITNFIDISLIDISANILKLTSEKIYLLLGLKHTCMKYLVFLNENTKIFKINIKDSYHPKKNQLLNAEILFHLNEIESVCFDNNSLFHVFLRKLKDVESLTFESIKYNQTDLKYVMLYLLNCIVLFRVNINYISKKYTIINLFVFVFYFMYPINTIRNYKEMTPCFINICSEISQILYLHMKILVFPKCKIEDCGLKRFLTEYESFLNKCLYRESLVNEWLKIEIKLLKLNFYELNVINIQKEIFLLFKSYSDWFIECKTRFSNGISLYYLIERYTHFLNYLIYAMSYASLSHSEKELLKKEYYTENFYTFKIHEFVFMDKTNLLLNLFNYYMKFIVIMKVMHCGFLIAEELEFQIKKDFDQCFKNLKSNKTKNKNYDVIFQNQIDLLVTKIKTYFTTVYILKSFLQNNHISLNVNCKL